MRVEVLYFRGCPNHGVTVARLREVLGVDAEVSEVDVTSAEMAKAIGFLGSPSVRLDGMDVEAEARRVGGFGMGCRTYVEQGRRSGAPSVEMLLRAVEERGTVAENTGARPCVREEETE